MKDPIEKLLADLDTKCRRAWKGRGSECASCPVGEVAALVAAALTFYRENRGRGHFIDAQGTTGGKATVETYVDYDPEATLHWSTEWERGRKL